MEQYISELNNKIKIALKEVKENINGAENTYYELIKQKIEAEKYADKLKDIKDINKKPLLNKYEEAIFNIIYPKLDRDRYILWCQASFSAFLSNKKGKDWGKYNLFFVDFLIVEKESKKPYLVIEYDGSQKHEVDFHTIAKDNFRDTICKKAGIEVIRLKAIKNINIKDKQDIDKMNEKDKDEYYKHLKKCLQQYYENHIREKLNYYQILDSKKY